MNSKALVDHNIVHASYNFVYNIVDKMWKDFLVLLIKVCRQKCSFFSWDMQKNAFIVSIIGIYI